MPNPYFHLLDTIADAVNPLLLVAALAMAIASLMKKDMFALIRLIYIAVVVYGMMLLDNALKIWELFGSDYSTHTAVALGLNTFIYFHMRHLIIRCLTWALFLIYCGLMLYQQYHTLLDVVSTIVVIGVLLSLLYWREGYLFKRSFLIRKN